MHEILSELTFFIGFLFFAIVAKPLSYINLKCLDADGKFF